MEYSEVSAGGELQGPQEPRGGTGSLFRGRRWGGGVGPRKAVTRECFEPGLQIRQGISPLHVGGREFSAFKSQTA